MVCVARDQDEEGGVEAAELAGPDSKAARQLPWDGDDVGSTAAAAAQSTLGNGVIRYGAVQGGGEGVYQHASACSGRLPRSGISVPHQATIDFNIAAVSRALAALFGTVAAAAAGTT